MNRSHPLYGTASFRRTAIVLMLLVSLLAAFPEVSGQAMQFERGDVAESEPRSSVSCSGEGSPAIVLVGGYGGGISDWQKVQPELAMHNQVCSYDRLVSQVDVSVGNPATAAAATKELLNIMELAEFESPVVLVGFSIGGLLARHFQAEHPDLVAGIVLIDPTPPEWPALRIGGASLRLRQDLVITLSGMDEREPERIDMLEVGNAVMASRRPSSPVVMLTAGVRVGSPGLYGDIQNALLNRLQADQEQDLSAIRVEAPLCSHQLTTECHGEVTRAVQIMLSVLGGRTEGMERLDRMPYYVALSSRRYRIEPQPQIDHSFV